MTDLELLAKAREATGFGAPKDQQMQIKTDGASILADQHIQLLKDDKCDLEQQARDLNEEIKRLNVELETANKSIWDKERAIKQDKREIDHQDNVLRTNKTKLQEVFEQLNVKELNLKNSEKEIDNLRADIKKNELRFEQQK
jgi:chromosome segregation ATPase